MLSHANPSSTPPESPWSQIHHRILLLEAKVVGLRNETARMKAEELDLIYSAPPDSKKDLGVQMHPSRVLIQSPTQVSGNSDPSLLVSKEFPQSLDHKASLPTKSPPLPPITPQKRQRSQSPSPHKRFSRPTEICFKFQHNNCHTQNCTFLHACLRCYTSNAANNHSLEDCTWIEEPKMRTTYCYSFQKITDWCKVLNCDRIHKCLRCGSDRHGSMVCRGVNEGTIRVEPETGSARKSRKGSKQSRQ
ncbi:hypothetical protein BCR33DRAFT_846932, partial [Rhizoclosmatium globosum]